MPGTKIYSNSTPLVESTAASTTLKQSPARLDQLSDKSTSSTPPCTSEDYLNKKIAFIQNHINNLLVEITNLPEPWTYAVTEDGRVFFINEDEQKTTWLHPRTGQPVSVMIIPPLEDLPTGWQKDYILGLPYLIDHNSRQNFINSTLAKAVAASQANPISTSTTTTNTKQPVGSSNTSSVSTSSNSSSPKKLDDVSSEHCISSDKMKVKYNADSPKLISASDAENNPASLNSNLEHQNITSSSASTASNSSSQLNANINHNNNNVNIAVDSALRKYGWLYKLSQNGFKLWRKRYFVLTDYILDYYSDSTMSKHCGTIFLNGTHSRPTIKKDGGSANNKKYSFKVELVQDSNDANEKTNTKSCTTGGASNDMYIYLAAESTASMNEWINKFNFVSKLKDNSRLRNSLSDKQQFGTLSNRSASISSLKSNSNVCNFIIKHDSSSQKSKSKSNSAPSSPNLSKSNSKTAGASSSSSKSNSSKIRSSMSSSSKTSEKNNENNNKKVIKKLAFSDDEIINDKPEKSSKKSKSKEKEPKQVDLNESLEKSDNSDNAQNSKFSKNANKHKRSTSLTKSLVGSSSKSTSKNGSSAIYDYKSIYDAFEKPIKDLTSTTAHLSLKSTSTTKPNVNRYNKPDNYSDFKKQPLLDTYLSTEKMAAASAAAMAAAVNSQRDKERDYVPNRAFNSILNPVPKVISNFYNITRNQIESLPKNEIQMLIRQLRRNFVLLNQSQQRFTLLHKLFEPYELIYQHKQSQQNEGKNEDTLTQCLHDSYKTMRDRIIKIEMKMDAVEDSLKLAQQYYDSTSSSPSYSDDYNSCGKYSSYFRLYEYQIVEMQHEYELLLEDKIIIDKLLDNQMKIFSKYKNLSSEKTLIQQYNALNQEMDLLKLQLTKINQLLNDTIAEKCKKEIKHHQQLSTNQKPNAESLFRADLVPTGMTSSNLSECLKSPSSVWKMNTPPPPAPNKQTSGSIENVNKISNSTNYSQMTPKSNQANNKSYNPNHHYYCLNNETSFVRPNTITTNLKMDNNMSKSIDSIYTPPSSLNSNSNNTANNPKNPNNNLTTSLMNGSAFNMTKRDECQNSFQPIRSKPQQLPQPIQPQQPTLSQTLQSNKAIKETRDYIAEKKRASIGKYPPNLNYQYFQPIPVQHCPAPQTAQSQQQQQLQPQQNPQASMNSISSSSNQSNAKSARERLFGGVNNNNLYNQQQQQLLNQMDDQMNNNRKIAMVKPELRGSCENDLIQRFTQQNQMEYFDADYTEELVKNIQKPDVYTIPRGNLELEPEANLTEEEQRAKEKRMLEIKKMIALQSLQQIFIDDINNYGSNYFKPNPNSNYGEVMLEKEKRSREQLLELRHDIAEQIKEKSRQSANMSSSMHALNSGLASTPPSTSIPIEIDNKINESKPTFMLDSTPNSHEYFRNTDNSASSIDKKRQQLEHDYYSMQMLNESVLNSTPAPPTPNFHAIFNLNNYNPSAAEMNSFN